MFARTEAQRRKNTAIVNRRRILLEAWVEPKLRRAMVEAGRNSALEYTRGGLGRVQAIALSEYKKDLSAVLEDLYGKSAKAMLGLIKDSAKGVCVEYETKGEAELDYVLNRALEWFGVHALEQSTQISHTMFEEIQWAVEAGLAEGAGEREIGRAIRKRVEGMAPWQANRIARTETLMATSKAQDEFVDQVDDLPPMAKEWDSSRDSRTRKDHRRVEPVLKDERFIVGGKEMRYPGDPAGGAKNVVNCRCVCNYAPADQIEDLRQEAIERELDIEEELLFDDDAFVEPDL